MKTIGRRYMIALACALAVGIATAHAGAPQTPRKGKPSHSASDYEKREDVNAFIDETAKRYRFAPRALRKLFARVKAQPSVVRAMTTPVEQPPKWYEYAPSLLNDARIEHGLRFWRDNARALAAAEKEFGVPPEIVVAIIGVETFYGRIRGRYRVIDALTTLAFDYPRRAEFFRKELTEFLLLCREQKLSPLQPRGSFAGAMGLPQFMPATFRSYAVDFDRDGRIDIWRDNDDTIGSVANFLEWHGWQRDGPVLVSAQIDREEVLAQLAGGLGPRRSLNEWELDGVRPRELLQATMTDDAMASLVMLEEPAVFTYWLGFNNFYVITRYNRSRLYAAAVWELASKIKQAYQSSASGFDGDGQVRQAH